MRTLILLIIMVLSVPECMAKETVKIVKKVQEISTAFIKKQEVAKFFDDYLQYYNDYLNDTSKTKPLKQLANSYHFPSFQVVHGVPIRKHISAEKIAKGLQAFLDRLLTKGVTSIKWEKIHIQMLTDKTAYASNVGVRYKENGEEFNKVAADYFVFKTDEVWEIATLILHSPEPYNNLQIKNEVQEAIYLNLKNYNDILSYDDIISDSNPSFLSTGGKMNTPAINISQTGDFILFDSKQQVVTDRKSFIFAINAKGATHINYDKVQIKMLSKSTAVSSNIASINTKDGTPLFKIGVTYLFNKTDDGWKIILRTFHAPKTILNLNSEKTS